VPVVGEDGAPRTVRACADGPVFRGDRVRWAHLDADLDDSGAEA
jgi:dihydroorotate dehydrogenase electron transfer subunit